MKKSDIAVLEYQEMTDDLRAIYNKGFTKGLLVAALIFLVCGMLPAVIR